jgi:hypothetical protein
MPHSLHGFCFRIVAQNQRTHPFRNVLSHTGKIIIYNSGFQYGFIKNISINMYLRNDHLSSMSGGVIFFVPKFY